MTVNISLVGKLALSVVGVIAAGAVGATVALTGVITRPSVVAPLTSATIDSRTVNGYACIDGPAVATLDAGQRVLVVAQSADSNWVGVRNPNNVAQTVWLEQPLVTLDVAASLPETIPVGGACPVVTAELLAAPQPSAEPTAPGTTAPEPGPVNPAPPARDTIAPSLSSPTVQPVRLGCDPGSGPGNGIVTVAASDNVAVIAVQISWTGPYTGSASMTPNGSSWRYTFDAHNLEPFGRGDVSFVMVAVDAAGNRSAPSTTSVFIDCAE